MNENVDYEIIEDVLPAEPPPQRLNTWVRGLLVLLACFLISGFSLAIYLNPYKDDGSAKRMETHRQLTIGGKQLPECTFKEKTGLPCPSCGMTSSFALFVRGDLWNSAKANWVGTLLATFCLCLIPWSFASAWLKRPVLVRSLEMWISISIITLLSLLLLRWAIVLIYYTSTGTTPTP